MTPDPDDLKNVRFEIRGVVYELVQADVWDVPVHNSIGSDGEYDLDCEQCGEAWPYDTSERTHVYYEDEYRPDDAVPLWVLREAAS